MTEKELLGKLPIDLQKAVKSLKLSIGRLKKKAESMKESELTQDQKNILNVLMEKILS